MLRLSRAARAIFRISGPKPTFSATVMRGKSA